jgi:hypothetical protein
LLTVIIQSIKAGRENPVKSLRNAWSWWWSGTRQWNNRNKQKWSDSHISSQRCSQYWFSKRPFVKIKLKELTTRLFNKFDLKWIPDRPVPNSFFRSLFFITCKQWLEFVD